MNNRPFTALERLSLRDRSDLIQRFKARRLAAKRLTDRRLAASRFTAGRLTTRELSRLKTALRTSADGTSADGTSSDCKSFDCQSADRRSTSGRDALRRDASRRDASRREDDRRARGRHRVAWVLIWGCWIMGGLVLLCLSGCASSAPSSLGQGSDKLPLSACACGEGAPVHELFYQQGQWLQAPPRRPVGGKGDTSESAL